METNTSANPVDIATLETLICTYAGASIGNYEGQKQRIKDFITTTTLATCEIRKIILSYLGGEKMTSSRGKVADHTLYANTKIAFQYLCQKEERQSYGENFDFVQKATIQLQAYGDAHHTYGLDQFGRRFLQELYVLILKYVVMIPAIRLYTLGQLCHSLCQKDGSDMRWELREFIVAQYSLIFPGILTDGQTKKMLGIIYNHLWNLPPTK